MKEAIATSKNYTVFGSLESVTFYYADGKKKTVEINPIKKSGVPKQFSLIRFYNKEFY